MVDSILNMMVLAVDSVIAWFGQIMSKTGMGSVYLVMMSCVLTVSLLLSPLLGAIRAGSDTSVKESSKKQRYTRDNSGD